MSETELLKKLIEEYKQDLANAMFALSTAKNYIANIQNSNLQKATLTSHRIFTLPATALLCLQSIESIESKIKHNGDLKDVE